MSDMQINAILQQIQSFSPTEVKSSSEILPNELAEDTLSFSKVLGETLRTVSQQQQAAGSLVKRFEAGDSTVDLPQVMIAMEKSSVAFEATKQVRNKLIGAYQEIMNMQM